MKNKFTKFTVPMIDGLDWGHAVPLCTDNGHYRVTIEWSLDRYTVRVYRRVQEPEWFCEVHEAFYLRTAVTTANRMLRLYRERG
jgi:hypothetical protein